MAKHRKRRYLKAGKKGNKKVGNRRREDKKREKKNKIRAWLVERSFQFT
jgi:hypothetical protein